MEGDGFRLDGKIALVTGAGQGIGRALAMGLARAGASVAVTDRASNMTAAKEVQQEIEKAGDTARAYPLDVQDIPGARKVIDLVAAEMGRLDIMVNNAGVQLRGPSVEVTEEEWDQTMDVNLKGLFFCAQAAARHMLAQGSGRIINVASQLAIRGLPERAAYCASKGGVLNLTRALALEWAQQGITVNAIGPGPTNTPLLQPLPSEANAAILARSPMGRRLEPEELVGAVVFLAGPSAGGVNGHLLLVDTGLAAS